MLAFKQALEQAFNCQRPLMRTRNNSVCSTSIVTAQIDTRIFRDNGERFLVVSKELCYGKAETLEDAEEAVRGWRYNLER